MKEGNRNQPGRATGKLYVIGSTEPKPPNVPARAAFVPRELRDIWADAWRNRRVSLMKLVRSNKPLRLLDIEAAIIDALDRRDRREEAMRLQREHLAMPAKRAA